MEPLDAEESGDGVTASAITPGYVGTDRSDWIEDRIPADEVIEVGDVVELVDGLLKLSSRAVLPRPVVTRAGECVRRLIGKPKRNLRARNGFLVQDVRYACSRFSNFPYETGS